jgi:deoxyribonuclease V
MDSRGCPEARLTIVRRTHGSSQETGGPTPTVMMKAILDVHYCDGRAHAACVAFESWLDGKALETFRVSVPGVRPYRPGRFFEREMPSLLAVLAEADTDFSHIIIDGYVHLNHDTLGLGGHLHEALTYPAAVIGIAKNPLAVADRFTAIHRGRSAKPLFVSAIGCSLGEASEAIGAMHGPYRIPTLLRLADRIARGV